MAVPEISEVTVIPGGSSINGRCDETVEGVPLITGTATAFGDRAKAAAKGPELASDLEAYLRSIFDRSMAAWGSLGLFALGRVLRPTFEEYSAGFAPYQQFTQLGLNGELDTGYNEVNFVPDIPLIAEDPEVVTMCSLLERALLEEFKREGKDKPANTLVIKTRRNKKMVLIESQVNSRKILWISRELLEQQMVHTEEDHGGIIRLERPLIMLPQDLKRESMNALDWEKEVGKFIPSVVKPQTLRDGLAFMIQFIRTHHYIPDAVTPSAGTSQAALMPGTHFPSLGTVAVASFNAVDGQFDIGSVVTDDQSAHRGVRGGLIINKEVS